MKRHTIHNATEKILEAVKKGLEEVKYGEVILKCRMVNQSGWTSMRRRE